MADNSQLPGLPSEAEIEQNAVNEVKQHQQAAAVEPDNGLPSLPSPAPVTPVAVVETSAPVPPPVVEPQVEQPKPVPPPPPEPTPMPKPEKIEQPVVKTPPAEPQKVVVETKPQKIVVEDRKRGIGCSCRMLSCGGCLLLLAGLVAVVVILIQRPPSIVNPVKQWLNADLQAAPGNGTTTAAAYADLAAQASSFKVGDNSLVVTQNELQAIIQEKYTGKGTVNTLILPGKIKLFIDGDSTAAIPLWVVAEIASEDGQTLHLTKLGTERVGLPSFMNDFLTRVIFSVANLVNQSKADSGNLLSAVLPLPDNIQLKSVKMEQGVLTINITLSSGFENLFSQ